MLDQKGILIRGSGYVDESAQHGFHPSVRRLVAATAHCERLCRSVRPARAQRLEDPREQSTFTLSWTASEGCDRPNGGFVRPYSARWERRALNLVAFLTFSGTTTTRPSGAAGPTVHR